MPEKSSSSGRKGTDAISCVFTACRTCGSKNAAKFFAKQGSQKIFRDEMLITHGEPVEPNYYGNLSLAHKSCFCPDCFYTNNEKQIIYAKKLTLPRDMVEIELSKKPERLALIRNYFRQEFTPEDLKITDIFHRFLNEETFRAHLPKVGVEDILSRDAYAFFSEGKVQGIISKIANVVPGFEWRLFQLIMGLPRTDKVIHLLFMLDRISAARMALYEAFASRNFNPRDLKKKILPEQNLLLTQLNFENFDAILLEQLELQERKLDGEPIYKVAFNYVQDAHQTPGKRYFYLAKALKYFQHSYRLDTYIDTPSEAPMHYKAAYLIVYLKKLFGEDIKQLDCCLELRKALLDGKLSETPLLKKYVEKLLA